MCKVLYAHFHGQGRVYVLYSLHSSALVGVQHWICGKII
jgi:hypothetical protein